MTVNMKQMIAETLAGLLKHKSIDKITVRELVDACGISRQTFYYHFQDIYDLVEWVCLEDAKKALEEKKTHDTWQQGLLQIFNEVKSNKPFIMNVYQCIDRGQVERYLTPLTDNLLMGVVEEESADMHVRREDKAFIARVYSYCFVGIMLDWIKDDMKEDPEIIVEKLALILEGNIKAALDRLKVSQ